MTDNQALVARFTHAVNALALAVDAEVWDDFKQEAEAVSDALRACDRDLATTAATEAATELEEMAHFGAGFKPRRSLERIAAGLRASVVSPPISPEDVPVSDGT